MRLNAVWITVSFYVEQKKPEITSVFETRSDHSDWLPSNPEHLNSNYARFKAHIKNQIAEQFEYGCFAFDIWV